MIQMPPLVPYDPRDWYWIVAGDTRRVYSSARASYVSTADAGYVSWLTAGKSPTIIDSEDSLHAVLVEQFPAGWPGEATKRDARTALAATDDVVLSYLERGSALPASWRSYRTALRAIISGQSTAKALPASPSATTRKSTKRSSKARPAAKKRKA
jgi:hypothetical protein